MSVLTTLFSHCFIIHYTFILLKLRLFRCVLFGRKACPYIIVYLCVCVVVVYVCVLFLYGVCVVVVCVLVCVLWVCCVFVCVVGVVDEQVYTFVHKIMFRVNTNSISIDPVIK